jgi:hypothetical protein
MSYSIYYDRAFIRVDDKFVPLVNSGSNNCFQFSWNGREIPEKDWGVLNWKRPGRLIFSPEEIRVTAREYDRYNQESGMIFKSRYRQFGSGEFERWVINGMKRAYAVEEYHSFGNRLYVLDYSPPEINDWRKHPFSTTEELTGIIERLGTVPEINIKADNNREMYRPVNHRPRSRGLRADDLPEYYILAGEDLRREMQRRTVYLVRLTKYGFRYLTYRDSNAVKIFRTERDAARYIAKYADRLNKFAAFKPELVAKAGGLP